jgi:hypothetical protein
MQSGWLRGANPTKTPAKPVARPRRTNGAGFNRAFALFRGVLLGCGIALLLSTAVFAKEKLVWKATDKGTQGFWHEWPDKIYAGPIGFTAKEVDSTPDGFTFGLYNVYAECAYRATRISSRPNDNKPGDTDAAKPMLFSRAFRMDKLPKMTLKGQQFHLPAEISAVNEDGSEFTGVFTFAGEDVTCKVQRTQYKVTKNPLPDLRELRYGPHFRHTIDFYKARADKPTPLVVSIHGGGWGALDKSMLQIDVKSLLSRGISVAAINYRYCGQGATDKLEPPVAAPLLDAARAIQFMRSRAVELNIDKQRIAATGGSAGGCSSLWLAFHEDLADPASADPVARESTRLWCVGGTAAQTSLDPRQMAEWLPGVTYGPHAFGVSGHGKSREAAFQEFLARREEWLSRGYLEQYSPWALVTPDSPPAYLEYPGSPLDPQPGETGWQTHSPRFGFQLKKKMDELKVECHFTCADVRDREYPNMVAFFVKKLTKP